MFSIFFLIGNCKIKNYINVLVNWKRPYFYLLKKYEKIRFFRKMKNN